MKKTLLLAALLLIAGASARTLEQIKAAGTVKIGTEGAFPPFNYFEGKKLTGFEVELGEAIAKQMGVKFEWVPQSFDSLLIGLNQNRFDFVIASHGITAERQKAVDFSDPHYCGGGAIGYLAGGPAKVADLKGKKVAVQVGTTYLDAVKKLSGIGEVKTYPKDTDAQQALMSKRVDAWVGDKFGVIEAIKANSSIKLGEQVFSERNAMAIAKGNTTLTAALNAALKKVQADGTYAKLSTKYFGSDIRCK